MFLPVSPMKEQKRGAKSIVPAPVVPRLPFIMIPHAQPEGPHLLVAESNIPTARRIKQQLELTGKSVMLASSGVEGLLLGLKEPFDLIIFNTVLDSFNGLELIRLLRSSGKHMPAIAMVEADFDLKSVPSQFGVSCFINKPVDIKELQEKIVGLLGET